MIINKKVVNMDMIWINSENTCLMRHDLNVGFCYYNGLYLVCGETRSSMAPAEAETLCFTMKKYKQKISS